MIHKNCGGQLTLDLSGMYIINSPAININTKGITPGMIQIDAAPERKNAKLICGKCGQVFSKKEEFEEEILEDCPVCKQKFPPSKIIITDYISRICTGCLSLDSLGTSTKKSNSNYDVQRNILSLYGEAIRTGENPTLLTILMKK